MKGQWKKSGQAMAILFAAAVAGLAQTNMLTDPAGNAAGGSYPAITQTAPQPMKRGMAYPGTVNYVEGQASLNGQALSPRTAGSTVVGPNQSIDTGNGYVEVLLTPGAFLRIGHDSHARILSAGLAAVNVQLDRGSAMVEAAELVKGSQFDVRMNNATTRIERKGLYAFDVSQGSVRVLDGKAQVSDDGHETTLKKSNEVLLASSQPLKKQDFNMKAAETDPLYVWSKVRSENESEANVNAANTIAVNGGWYGPGWYWDPFWADYAFIPGSGILYSPFGWGYFSPGLAFYAPYGYGLGLYGRAYHGQRLYGHNWNGHGHVWNGHSSYSHGVRPGSATAGVRAFHGSAFHSGGFAGGGFHGGGFHGGGRR